VEVVVIESMGGGGPVGRFVLAGGDPGDRLCAAGDGDGDRVDERATGEREVGGRGLEGR